MKISSKLENILPDEIENFERDLIIRAYKVASKAHEGQYRSSGQLYISHCVAVAEILSQMKLPANVIAAGLLHDTVEDTDVSLSDIREDFGNEIAHLVEAVTKLSTLPRISHGSQLIDSPVLELSKNDQIVQLDLENRETEIDETKKRRNYDLSSENLVRTIFAMADDPRVILIKLADRLHNMRTLNYLSEERSTRIAKETMDIFAPLANRLGIWQIKWELEDLSFRYINPNAYREIADYLNATREKRVQEIQIIVDQVRDLLNKKNIVAEVTGRPKHIYSIYEKMKEEELSLNNVHDIRGIRIFVENDDDCYVVLGIVHSRWRPRKKKVSDYIAAPKDNLYRSLHTTVFYDDGGQLEIQIRTHEMHQNAEYGIAAHWRYKEGRKRELDYDERVVKFRHLLTEWRKDVEDAREFVDGMKSDVFGDRVYVFTPRGDIIDLPAGATPIDFAYHVHTEIGHRCRGAKIGGVLESLDYELKTGDQVDILTTKRGGPSRDWLNPHLGLVRTQRARSKIRRWFKLQDREQNISQGKALLERELRQLGLSNVNLEQLARKFEYKNFDDFAEAIGCGDIAAGKIANGLITTHEDEDDFFDFLETDAPRQLQKEATGDIAVRGLKGLLTNMGRCCNPTPGDDIVGYITRGRGATIHRADCPNILRIQDRERLVQVSWGVPTNTFPVPIRVKAYDRDGLLKDVSTLLADEKINMNKVRVDVTRSNTAIFDLIIEVRDVEHLSRVLDRLEGLGNVFEARRVRPG